MGYPEIDANQCSDVRIFNNIMYGRGAGTNCKGNDLAIYDYNMYWNGTVYKKGVHDIQANPLFISLSTNPLIANFALTRGSRAVNAGYKTDAPTIDILGIASPKGVGIDMGAYESY